VKRGLGFCFLLGGCTTSTGEQLTLGFFFVFVPYDKTVLSDRVGGDSQGRADQQEDVVEKLDPDQTDTTANDAGSDERDKPADLG